VSSSAAPSGFPSGIPISRERFVNWAQMIDVPSVWTCVPQTEGDVVRVCNWATGAGFSVRARGIMHTWSPLTVTQGESTDKLLQVDLTQKLNRVVSITPAMDDRPAQVVVQAGATMDKLMAALEDAPGGRGINANGFSFAHIPAPGNITVGGALAINAHGTAIPRLPNDDFDIPYGSLSNQVLAFTAVVTMPGSTAYTAQEFTRGDADAKAFLAHCGRALLLSVTLQIVDNYNLRCQSFMSIPSTTLFARPTGNAPPPGSVGEYLDHSGRIEVIWFPSFPILGITPPSYPWLKVWTVTPGKPPTSRTVTGPYNYPFSDNLPAFVTDLLKWVLSQAPWSTPLFTQTFASFTANQLESAADLWGASKNTLLYVKDTTLRVTANGYAVLMKRAQIQQAIADFTSKFSELLAQFQSKSLWPINSPLEIRVTALDDPSKIVVPAGQTAQSPVISSLSVDPVVQRNSWDVACWFDVLTVIPDKDPQHAYEYYAQLEAWLYSHFADGFRICPEWSKGWAYTSGEGAWTNAAVIQDMRETFTAGRSAGDTWSWEVQTLAKYDQGNLFSNPFLKQLFTV
jgi:hypothetical protein